MCLKIMFLPRISIGTSTCLLIKFCITYMVLVSSIYSAWKYQKRYVKFLSTNFSGKRNHYTIGYMIFLFFIRLDYFYIDGWSVVLNGCGRCKRKVVSKTHGKWRVEGLRRIGIRGAMYGKRNVLDGWEICTSRN